MAETTYASLLDNFTKELYTGIITAELPDDTPLLDALTKNIDRANFDTNGNAKILIETERGRNARGLADGGNLPTARSSSYVEMTVPVQRVLATCGLTEKVKRLLTGGQASWGPMVSRTIDNMIKDFRYARNIAAAGNGTGALARVSAIAAYGSGEHVISCDNAYKSSNIENVSLIQVGMYVSIWDIGVGAFVADSAGATEFKVTAVAPAKRTAAGSYAPVTGTFTIESASDLSDGPAGSEVGTVSDNDIVFLPATRAEITTQVLPMGLGGMVANYVTGTYHDNLWSPFYLQTIQGLDRTNYPSLRADVWQATDFGTGSLTDGIPTLWDLSCLSDAIDEVVARGGNTELILCHPEMARTMNRLNRSESSVNVVVSTTKGENLEVVGSVRPTLFLGVNNEQIPIVTDRFMPRYVIRGINLATKKWSPVGNPDFRKDYGTIWGPTRGGNATTIECGYEHWYELLGERFDWDWQINDLRVDL